MNFMLDLHTREHGYEEVWVPFAREPRDRMTGTGQLPKFEDDMYASRDDDLFLVPTAEVPVTNLYRDEILDGGGAADGVSSPTRPAFAARRARRQGHARAAARPPVRQGRAGALRDARGRSPQLELLHGARGAVLQLLGLPYRVKLLAAGDTGFASAKTYDLEVWAPGVGAWLEVSSCSTFTDFQARRANIRYRAARGEKPRFVHTLNGSGARVPAHDRRDPRASPAPDGTVARARSAAPVSRRPTFWRDLSMRRGAPVVLVGLVLALLLGSYVVYTQRVVRELRRDASAVEPHVRARLPRAERHQSPTRRTPRCSISRSSIRELGVPIIVTDARGRPACGDQSAVRPRPRTIRASPSTSRELDRRIRRSSSPASARSTSATRRS